MHTHPSPRQALTRATNAATACDPPVPPLAPCSDGAKPAPAPQRSIAAAALRLRLLGYLKMHEEVREAKGVAPATQ